MKQTKYIITLLLTLFTAGIQAQSDYSSWPDYNPSWQPAYDHLYNNMVRVEGGSYQKDGQTVTVGSFYVCRYEVTQALWEKMMTNNSENVDPMMPVENVKWADCQEFLRRLEYYFGKKFRLLTESEWEWAARGGNLSQGYVYAGSNNIDNVAWYQGNSEERLHRVGLKQPNELGLYDMSGNVAEWCQDSLPTTTDARRREPIPDLDLPDDVNPVEFGTYHVLKGGAWWSEAPDCAVSATDAETDLHSGYAGLGLRLAMDIDVMEPPTAVFQVGIRMGSTNGVVDVDLNNIGYDPQAQQFLFPYIDDDGNEARQAIDIQNVSYIERGSSDLALQTGDELEQSITDIINSGNADPEAIAAALQENSSVAEAYTEDDQNVVVRLEGESYVTIYPVRTLADAFYEQVINTPGDDEGMVRRRTAKLLSYPKTGENGQVIVFNYFSDDSKREGQNKILEGLMDEFYNHQYGIDYHPIETFTSAEVEAAVKASQQETNKVRAIIIMSEGAIVDGRAYRSFFATGEQVPTGSADSFKDAYGRSFLAMQVQSLHSAGHNCILYIGSCFAFDEDGILADNTYVGWKGQNAIATAHASLLFHRMLNNRWTLDDAMQRLWQQDPITGTALRCQNKKTDATVLSANSSIVPEYEIGLHPTLTAPDGDYAFKKKNAIASLFYWYNVNGTWAGSQAMPANDCFYVRLVPLMSGKKSYEYKIKANKDLSFSKSIVFDTEMNGVYDVQFGLHSGFTTTQIRATQVPAFVYSTDFPTNAVEPLGEQPDHIISLLYEDSTEVGNIVMEPGQELRLIINESESHEYQASLRDRGASASTASVSGSTLTLKAGNECHTKLIVWQADNEDYKDEYDLVVQRSTPQPVASTVSYEYDALYRLVKVTTSTYVTTYSYDALGNRTSKTVSAQGPDVID